MVRRTKEEAQETRNRLLDTAEQLFQRKGVSRTSLHEIAQAAGVTRGAVYWHFRDKAELFDAMMERATLPFEQTACFVGGAVMLEEPLATIRQNMIDVLIVTISDARVRRVFDIAMNKVEYVDEQLAVRDRHLVKRNRCLMNMELGLLAAVERGQLKSTVPPHALALTLFALMDGLMYNWLLDPSAFDLLAVGTQAIDTYLDGVCGNPACASAYTVPLRAAAPGGSGPVAPDQPLRAL